MPELVNGFTELKNQGRGIDSIRPDQEPDPNVISDISQLRLIDGLNLTRDEFEKACRIGQLVLDYKTDLKGEKRIEYIADVFCQEVKSKFSYSSKFEWLTVKDEFPEEAVNLKILAARFALRRPLLYFIVDKMTNEYTVIDEKQFDAFERGPFKRPKI